MDIQFSLPAPFLCLVLLNVMRKNMQHVNVWVHLGGTRTYGSC